MASTSLKGGCVSWLYLSTRACTWSLEGKSLVLSLGEGLQRSRDCEGALKESLSKPQTLRLMVSLVDGELELHDKGGLRLSFRRVP